MSIQKMLSLTPEAHKKLMLSLYELKNRPKSKKARKALANEMRKYNWSNDVIFRKFLANFLENDLL